MLRTWQALRKSVWQRMVPSSDQDYARPLSSDFTFSSTDPPVPWPGFSSDCGSRGRAVRKPKISRTAIQTSPKSYPDTQKPITTRSDSPYSESTGDHTTSCDRLTSHPASPGSVSQAFTEPGFTLGSHKVRRNADARYSIILGTTFPLPFELMDVQNPLHQFATRNSAAPVMSTSLRPARECVVCGDNEQGSLLAPCEHCDSAYCKACVREMFLAATKDTTRMPPKCCAMFQLNIGLPLLNSTEKSAFQDRFEEWISIHRLYCPEKCCSAFIPDRIVNKIFPTPGSRQSIEDGQANADFVGLAKSIRCQKCLCWVCLDCRQHSHIGSPCDLSQAQEVERMLEKLNYKTCPNCRTGVKRMFGCPHMQCHCGAHWCWFCKSPIEECNGAHDDEENDEEDEEGLDYDEEAESEEEEVAVGGAEHGGGTEDVERAVDADNDTIMVEAGPVNNTVSRLGPGSFRLEQADGHARDPPPAPNTEEVENLDALGYRQWSNGDWDFGDEPEDARSTIWGCHHRWKQVRATEGFKHVERASSVYCNCCFKTIRMPESVAPASNMSAEAYACSHCNVLYCDTCRNVLHPLHKL